MRQELFKFLVLFSVCVTLSACSASTTSMYDKDSFFDRTSKRAFEKEATIHFTVPAHTTTTSLSLFTAPALLEGQFSLPGTYRVLSVRLREQERLNIEQHLILGKDYKFSQQKDLLKVQFDIPLVYVQDGCIRFFLDIVCIESYGSSPRIVPKKIIFNWQPRISKKKGASGFTYADPVSKNKYALTSEFKAQLALELSRTNLDRFNPKYADLVQFMAEQ